MTIGSEAISYLCLFLFTAFFGIAGLTSTHDSLGNKYLLPAFMSGVMWTIALFSLLKVFLLLYSISTTVP